MSNEPKLPPLVVSTLVNSQNERLTIERVQSGRFKGCTLLVLHEDEGGNPHPVWAPMLLDSQTVQFLLYELAKLADQNTQT